jgi:hypothetical protein
VTDQLVEKLSRLSISDSTQISKVPKEIDSGSTTPEEINPESSPGSIPEVSGPYPLGLRNTAFTYQDSIQGQVNPVREILLAGAQEGLVLSVTPQGFIVHWPGSRPKMTLTRILLG